MAESIQSTRQDREAAATWYGHDIDSPSLTPSVRKWIDSGFCELWHEERFEGLKDLAALLASTRLSAREQERLRVAKFLGEFEALLSSRAKKAKGLGDMMTLRDQAYAVAGCVRLIETNACEACFGEAWGVDGEGHEAPCPLCNPAGTEKAP